MENINDISRADFQKNIVRIYLFPFYTDGHHHFRNDAEFIFSVAYISRPWNGISVGYCGGIRKIPKFWRFRFFQGFMSELRMQTPTKIKVLYNIHYSNISHLKQFHIDTVEKGHWFIWCCAIFD